MDQGTCVPEDKFRTELTSLINRHCKENVSNTPDYILSHYLLNCLTAFDEATQLREQYYGRDPRPKQNDLLSHINQQ